MTNTDDPAANGAAERNARDARRALRDDRRASRRRKARTLIEAFRSMPDVPRWRCVLWAVIALAVQWVMAAVAMFSPPGGSWMALIFPTLFTAAVVPYIVWVKRQGTKGWGWYLHWHGRLIPTSDDIRNFR